MEEINQNNIRQKYVVFCMLAQQLIAEINHLNPDPKEDSIIRQLRAQLERCLSLPATPESLHFFERQIDKLNSYKKIQSGLLNGEESASEKKESGYVMVKKSGQAFIPVKDEPQEIEKPNYDVPIRPSRESLREIPDFMFKDKPIRITPVTNYNRGSSHVWMLAFLTFLFETLFLLLSFSLYN